MEKDNKFCIYKQIIIDIERKIKHNFFDEMKPLPSLKELCESYRVSYMTAYRVYEELEKLGVVYGLKGKGFFIVRRSGRKREAGLQLPPLKGIVTFRTNHSGEGNAGDVDLLQQGMEECAKELNIPLRVIDTGEVSNLQIGDDEGTILRYDVTSIWILQMLKFKRLRTVLANNYFPEAHCVLHDNLHAMKSIVEYLENSGCRNIFACSRHFTDLGIANLNERSYAFSAECERRSLDYRLLTSGNYGELSEVCRSRTEAPDAIVFLTEAAARHFIQFAGLRKIKKKPHLICFGNSASPFPLIDSFVFDSVKLGRTAVKLMVNNAPEDWMLPDIIRVKGRFNFINP